MCVKDGLEQPTLPRLLNMNTEVNVVFDDPVCFWSCRSFVTVDLVILSFPSNFFTNFEGKDGTDGVGNSAIHKTEWGGYNIPILSFQTIEINGADIQPCRSARLQPAELEPSCIERSGETDRGSFAQPSGRESIET